MSPSHLIIVYLYVQHSFNLARSKNLKHGIGAVYKGCKRKLSSHGWTVELGIIPGNVMYPLSLAIHYDRLRVSIFTDRKNSKRG